MREGTYLVTGGGGFIGSNIVGTLIGLGARVRVLDNFATGRRSNLAPFAEDLELVEGDIRDPSAVSRAVEGVEYVLHLAALGSVVRSVDDPVTSNEVNVNGTLNILVAARDAGVRRLVFSSSSSVYGDTPTLPKHEDMPSTPLSPYALSKLTGEHYCRIFHRLYGLETFALRYFNVFGPRQDPKSPYAAVIPLFIEALLADRRPVIQGDGGQTRDFTFVADVVQANLRCCQATASAAGAVYNAARGDRTSVLDLACKIGALLDKPVDPVHGPPRPGDVRDSQADSTRARSKLGWDPQFDLNEGLRQTVQWFRSRAHRTPSAARDR